MSNKVIIINALLIGFRGVLFTNASLLQVMVCHSTVRGTFKRMSCENARAPRLAFSTIGAVDLIEYIIVASLSSTIYKVSCCVCGGHDKSIVFNAIALSVAYICLWH